MAACHARWDSQKKREQGAHDAEAKDPAWAYGMEQKLREYASQRLRETSIELREVDCKTTFCQIKAGGETEDSQRLFQQASQDAAAEPWVNLRIGEAGSSGYGNTWSADVTLYRQ